MARRSAKETVPVPVLRAHLLHIRDKRGGADLPLLFAAALRGPMRRIGPPREGRGLGPPLIGSYASYELRIGPHRISWEVVHPALRRALEVDLPPDRRSQRARDLAAFLGADAPTRVQYALARPALMDILEEIGLWQRPPTNS